MIKSPPSCDLCGTHCTTPKPMDRCASTQCAARAYMRMPSCSSGRTTARRRPFAASGWRCRMLHAMQQSHRAAVTHCNAMSLRLPAAPSAEHLRCEHLFECTRQSSMHQMTWVVEKSVVVPQSF